MNPARTSNEKRAPQSTIAAIVPFRDPMTDETLVAAAKRGDEKAFQHYTRVREDAEDVVQQSKRRLST
jgi:hypothetical protein